LPPVPRTRRDWVAVLFGAAGIALLPWAVWLSASLHPHHLTNRWDLTWTGFDVALALCFLGTAVAAHRASPWVAVFAAATGTLLVADAWVDIVLESHGGEERVAIFEAVVFELPIAAICFWIAYRTERFLERVVRLHLSASGEGPPEGDLIRVLEIPADGKPAGEPRHADPPA
jgi:hypothetical protein